VEKIRNSKTKKFKRIMMMRFPHLNYGENFSFLIFGIKLMKSFLFRFFIWYFLLIENNFQFQKYFIDLIFRVCHYTMFSFLLKFYDFRCLNFWGTTKIKHVNFFNLHFTNKILIVLITSKIEDIEKSSSY